ncbi:MAG: hypothetical protein M9947_08425 [Thermomicrobiales bacterium]|nr:hypothetical protein [Thermomicrobiales bacterium]
MPTIEEINTELKRTAFQKKAVVKLSNNDVMELARAYFADHGYRATTTGRPGHLLVMGGAEGILPRTTAEIAVRQNVGKAGTTLVTVDAAGERLGAEMKAFLAWLRAESKARSSVTR